MLNCLLDVGDKTGWVPDAWIAGHGAFRQGGCSAAVLACEAALKQLPGVDLAHALRLLQNDTEAESPNPYLHGRYRNRSPGLAYVSRQTPQSVSRHLEYRWQDACLAQLALPAGDSATAARFEQAAAGLWTLWRPELRAFAPRSADGTWRQPFDPCIAQSDAWNDPHFYEGSSREWSWNTQQRRPARQRGHARMARSRKEPCFG